MEKQLSNIHIFFVILQQISYYVLFTSLFLVANVLTLINLFGLFFTKTVTEERLKHIYKTNFKGLKNIMR